MSPWRRHRAHRNIRASSIAAPGGEGWTIRDHRAILRSEPYARADLGAASDVTAKSIQSEAAPVSPAPAISPQRHSAVIAPAHGDGISGNIGSGGKHVPGGVAGTIQCVLGRPSQITSRPDLHHLSALFGRREHPRSGAALMMPASMADWIAISEILGNLTIVMVGTAGLGLAWWRTRGPEPSSCLKCHTSSHLPA